jgi:DNA-binding transcriptional ArsR family regulator
LAVTELKTTRNPPTSASPLSTSNIDVVLVTRAVGDHLRANILKALAQDSFAVLELGDIFDVAQPAMSHHLKKLSEAGLVSKRREGTSVFYQRMTATNAPLLAAIYTALDEETLAPNYRRAIERIYKSRLARSKHFFTHQADALAQQTALICAPDVYVRAVVECATADKSLARHLALEVGPGSGTLLQALAPHFSQVVGVDNSAEMLAKTTAAVAQLPNATLVEQDFSALPNERTYDLVVAAMVVHHMPSPLGFFQQAARVLTHTGLLVVAELCNHDQDWVKKLCGDLWQGFSPEELANWSAQAGFTQIQQQFLAQRNGFRVQVSAYAL